MKILIITLVLSSFLATGCVSNPQKITVSAQFDAEQASNMLNEGSNSIHGSALIRQKGGGVVTCAGREVILLPVTAYASERVQALYGSTDRGYNSAGIGGRKYTFEGEHPQYMQLTKRAICDAQGYFKFTNISDGDFFVISSITWQINDYFMEGGSIMKRVSLSGDKDEEIVLAP